MPELGDRNGSLPPLLGESFVPYVDLQIKARQYMLGKQYKTDEELLYLNNNGAFINLYSSVDVLSDSFARAKLESIPIDFDKYKGVNLAEQFALRGGVEKRTAKTGEDQFNFTKRSGVFQQSPNDSNVWDDVYGFGGMEFGYKPIPGITSINVETVGRNGSLKRATINIKAYNKQQFDIIELLYLRLGYSVLLSYGHVYALKVQDGDYTKYTIESNKDRGIANWYASNSISTVKKAIQKGKLEQGGNYDGMVGKITNYNFSVDDKGVYSIVVKMVSHGDLLDSLTANDKNSIEEEENYGTEYKGPYILNGRSYSDTTNLLHWLDQRIVGGTSKGINTKVWKKSIYEEWIDKFVKDPTKFNDTISTSRTETKYDAIKFQTRIGQEFLDDVTVEDADGNSVKLDIVKNRFSDNDKFFTFTYITLGTYLQILNELSLFTDKSSNPPSNKKKIGYNDLLVFDNTSNYHFGLTHEYQLSSDPSICLINGSIEGFTFDEAQELAARNVFDVSQDELDELDTDILYKETTTLIPISYKKLEMDMDHSLGGELAETRGTKYSFENINVNYGPDATYDLDITEDETTNSFDLGGLSFDENIVWTTKKGTTQVPTEAFEDYEEQTEAFQNDVIVGGAEMYKYKKSLGNLLYGDIMNIYLNTEYLVKLLINCDKDRFGKLSIRNHVIHILDDVSQALGNINRFRLKVDDDTDGPSKAYIYDEISNPALVELSKMIGKERNIAPSLFNLNGYFTFLNQEKKPITYGSFVRKFNLKSKLGSKIAAFITIGAQSKGYLPGFDATAYSAWNLGLQDRFVTDLQRSNNFITNIENAEIQTTRMLGNLLYVYNALYNTSFSLAFESLESSKSILKKYLEADIATYIIRSQNEVINSGNTTTTLPSSPTVGFVPLDLELEMDGLSGAKIFQKFTIPGSFLPRQYPKQFDFVITKYQHVVDSKGWVTKINSLSIPKPLGTNIDSTADYDTAKANINFTRVVNYGGGSGTGGYYSSTVSNYNSRKEGGVPVTGNNTSAKPSELLSGLQSRGFTKEEACAIVGNMWAESRYQTGATNPSTQAYGLIQWLGSRKTNFITFAQEKGKDIGDLDVQLDYVYFEFKGGNTYETQQFEKAMNYGSSIAKKTEGFARECERAAPSEIDASLADRINNAEQAYDGTLIVEEDKDVDEGLARDAQMAREQMDIETTTTTTSSSSQLIIDSNPDKYIIIRNYEGSEYTPYILVWGGINSTGPKFLQSKIDLVNGGKYIKNYNFILCNYDVTLTQAENYLRENDKDGQVTAIVGFSRGGRNVISHISSNSNYIFGLIDPANPGESKMKDKFSSFRSNVYVTGNPKNWGSRYADIAKGIRVIIDAQGNNAREPQGVSHSEQVKYFFETFGNQIGKVTR